LNLTNVANKAIRHIKPGNVRQGLKEIPDQKIAEGILWGIPAAVVPFRQKLDNDRTNGESKELQYRDVITYTAGPVSYFAGEYGVRKLIEKTKIPAIQNMAPTAKKVASIGTGMALFMGWATYGAIKLAKKLVKHKKEEDNSFKNAENIKPIKSFNSEEVAKGNTPAEETSTTFLIKTTDKSNPYYLHSLRHQSQSFGNKDIFARFRKQFGA